jgi:phosphohistidine phosphatase SixA
MNDKSLVMRWVQARWLLGLAMAAMVAAAPAAAADAAAGAAADWRAVRPGSVVLFRHALAPGGGDPAGFQLNDCSTQRNLSDAGRDQARRIGQAFKRRGIEVGAVWSSQWCRARETADLAFPGQRVDQPAFNSFFGQYDAEPEQTRSAQALLAGWRGPGVLVVTTHQVNITALTGVVPASGEGVVVKPTGQGLTLLGRITP